MTDALSALDVIGERLTELVSAISSTRSKNISSAHGQPLARSIATVYFGSVRPHLEPIATRAGLVDEIDTSVQTLLQLATAPREKDAYLGQIAELRPYLLEATVDLMKAQGAPRLVLSATERAILGTLTKMLPAAALSYEQVLRDVAQGSRLSWRGTGAELREILRETMDHLAPDDKVVSAPGFQLEKDRKGPTQKQKVRFILKARKSSSAASEVVHSSLALVDEAVAALARSTYDRGSVSTHVGTSGVEVRNLKRYVEAVLAELLEIG